MRLRGGLRRGKLGRDGRLLLRPAAGQPSRPDSAAAGRVRNRAARRIGRTVCHELPRATRICDRAQPATATRRPLRRGVRQYLPPDPAGHLSNPPGVTETQQRRTLDLLRSCGLSTTAIVLGKLAARTVAVAGIVLVSLPLLAFAQLWGDVDTGFLLAATAVNLLTLMSLTALGVYCSALTNSAAAAAALTYLLTGVLVVVGGTSLVGQFINHARLFNERLGLLPFFPGVKTWAKPVLVYAFFHVSVTGVLIAATIRCLRPTRSRPDVDRRQRRAISRMRRGFRRDLALVFAAVPEPKSVKNRVHIDLSPSGCDQAEELDV